MDLPAKSCSTETFLKDASPEKSEFSFYQDPLGAAKRNSTLEPSCWESVQRNPGQMEENFIATVVVHNIH